MTDEFVLMLKNILDKAGVEITLEQLEAGLNAMPDEGPRDDPWLDEVIRKIEEEHKNRPEPEDERGMSFKGCGQYHVLSGVVELEYNGKTHKTYQGAAALLIKPDGSLLVHGPRGVKPVCYMARADGIWFRGRDRKMIVTAEAGGDQLVVTFVRSDFFESLIKELPYPEPVLQPGPISRSPPAPDAEKSPFKEESLLTEDEKGLEVRLKKLRADLADRHGISYLPAIFDNRIIRALVRQRPATIDDMKKVKGMGDKRIGKYGDAILQALREAPADPG